LYTTLCGFRFSPWIIIFSIILDQDVPAAPMVFKTFYEC